MSSREFARVGEHSLEIIRVRVISCEFTRVHVRVLRREFTRFRESWGDFHAPGDSFESLYPGMKPLIGVDTNTC